MLDGVLVQFSPRLVVHDVDVTSRVMDVPDDRKRFEVELEFINSLANPAYLQCTFCVHLFVLPHADASDYSIFPASDQPLPSLTGLVQTYGNDASFIDYLQYLEYWRQPRYAKFIMCHTLSS